MSKSSKRRPIGDPVRLLCYCKYHTVYVALYIFFKAFRLSWVGCCIIAPLALLSGEPPVHVATNSLPTFHLWTNDASLCVSTFSDAENWFCECPPLYTGRLCQFSTCERNPCSHGATCIPKSPLEAVCLCPYGRQGLLCEERKCYRSVQGITALWKSLGCKHITTALWAG